MCRYANAKQYAKAIADFKAALLVDPRHANANKYLAKTQSVYDQIESEKESARRGEFLLSSEHNSKLATSVKPVHNTEFSSFVDQLLKEEEPDSSHKRHKKAKKKHKKKEKKRKRRKESHDHNSDSSSESS
jgi:hypothetical protein